MESADKARRQRAIRAVLAEEPIVSQEDLRKALKRRGFPVTQATLSRDFKEMGVLWAPVEGGYRYVSGSTPEAATGPTPPRQLRNVAAMEVTGIEANENAVLVRTLNGRAQGVAVFLDELKHPELLGTIAGDDTILVLPRSVKRTSKLRKALAEILGLP